MAAINMVVTTAGLAALASAVQAGNTFEIDSVQIGTGQYTPTSAATALVTPFSPPRTFMNPSGNVQGTTASFGFTDDGDDAYNVGEVGVFSGTTLFSIASRPTAGGFLFAKQTTTPLLVSVHSVWSGVTNISSVTFADAPAVVQATTGAPGIVELATQAEVNARVDTGRVITPATLPTASSPPNAGLSDRGLIELATQAEVNALSDQERAVTPGRMPTAGASQKGLVELATQAEVNALSDGGRAVTPGNMPIASTSQRGVVELASNTETDGSSGSRVVTPGGLVSSSYRKLIVTTGNTRPAGVVAGDFWAKVEP